MGSGPDLPDPSLGVFDTLLVREGVAVDLDRHVDRLARSVRKLYGVLVEADALAARVVSESSVLGTARVRTTYEPSTSAWTVDATTIDEPGLQPRTLAVRRIGIGLGDHKWVDRRLVATAGNEDDVLLVDDAGLLLECGTANVFVVLGRQVLTPPLDGRILPGTVRARALEQLVAAGIPTAERPLDLAELPRATEVFTTSSVRGVQPVVACAGIAVWPVGERTSWLRARV